MNSFKRKSIVVVAKHYRSFLTTANFYHIPFFIIYLKLKTIVISTINQSLLKAYFVLFAAYYIV